MISSDEFLAKHGMAVKSAQSEQQKPAEQSLVAQKNGDLKREYQEQLKQKGAIDLSAELRNAAIGLLARREHSRRELTQKLVKRFAQLDEYSADVVDDLLNDLAESDLQSDERFCESYVRMRCRKGYGPVRVGMELRERGVSDNLVQQWLNDEQFDWYEGAASAWQKKFGRLPADHKERAKQQRFLQYRGFTSDQIREVYS